MCVCVCVCLFVQPYPDGWNLPGGGAQRGNVLNLNGAGDPLTPGYPAKGVKMYTMSIVIFAFLLFFFLTKCLLSDRLYLQIQN